LIATPARLRAALDALPRKTLHGPWSRAIGLHLLKGPPPGAPAGSTPQPLWAGGAALHGARFTPKGGFDCLYLASDPVTALHEVVSIFTPAGGPVFTLRTSPWVVVTVEGVLSNIIDLTDPAAQRKLRTNAMELTGNWAYLQATKGQAPTQILARAAFESGILGFQYKSAKNVDGGDSVVVFTSNLIKNHPSWLEVVDDHNNLNQRLP